MGITGPVIPKHFTPTTSTANNPSLSVDAGQFEEGEIFTDLQTGRMWVKGKSGTSIALRQILPMTRNDGTPSVVGTQMTNDAGGMKVANSTGSTTGSVNLFDKVIVDSTNIKVGGLSDNTRGSLAAVTPTGYLTPLFGAVDKAVPQWNDATHVWTSDYIPDFGSVALKSGDQSIAANTETLISGMTITPGRGTWLLTATVCTYHNNANRVSIGIRLQDFAPSAGYVCIAAASQEANGWQSITVQTTWQTGADNTAFKLVINADSAVTVKSAPAVTFASSGAYTPDTIPNKCTYFTAKRINY